jgi:hypothetical protein
LLESSMNTVYVCVILMYFIGLWTHHIIFTVTSRWNQLT